jgi:hypothetical protein
MSLPDFNRTKKRLLSLTVNCIFILEEMRIPVKCMAVKFELFYRFETEKIKLKCTLMKHIKPDLQKDFSQCLPTYDRLLLQKYYLLEIPIERTSVFFAF